MNRDEYLADIKDDCIQYINDVHDQYDQDDFESLWDEMCLSVTGNDVGSYYCDSNKAKKAISDLIWNDEILDDIKELGYDHMPVDQGSEACDVIVRVCLISNHYFTMKEYFESLKEAEQ